MISIEMLNIVILFLFRHWR